MLGFQLIALDWEVVEPLGGRTGSPLQEVDCEGLALVGYKSVPCPALLAFWTALPSIPPRHGFPHSHGLHPFKL